MMHHIKLPKNEWTSIRNLKHYKEDLHANVALINIFFCTESKVAYIIGYYYKNFYKEKELRLAIDEDIRANQSIASHLRLKLKLASDNLLVLDYDNITNNNACMFIDDENKQCYLTCVQIQEIGNLGDLKSRISAINKQNRRLYKFGIYQLSEIQQLCYINSYLYGLDRICDNRSMIIDNFLTETKESCMVYADQITNATFLFNKRKLFGKLTPDNHEIKLFEKPLKREVQEIIFDHLGSKELVQASMVSKNFYFFSKSENLWEKRLGKDFPLRENDICALDYNPLILYKACFAISNYINQQKITELATLIKENPLNFKVLLMLLPDNEKPDNKFLDTIFKLLKSHFCEYSFEEKWKRIAPYKPSSLSQFGQHVLTALASFSTLNLQDLCKLEKFKNYIRTLQYDLINTFILDDQENATKVLFEKLGSSDFRDLIIDAIFLYPNLCINLFKDFSALSILFRDCVSGESAFNFLQTNDDVFNYYIADKSTLYKCTALGRRRRELLIEKYDALNPNTDDNKLAMKF